MGIVNIEFTTNPFKLNLKMNIKFFFVKETQK